jgi:phage tail tube protein FII
MVISRRILKKVTKTGNTEQRRRARIDWPATLLSTFTKEMSMKLTNMKLTGLCAAIALTLASFGAYAGESHMAEALKHAEAAAKADDAKAITEHAEAAKTHAKTADEHLDAGITSLNDAIDHGKMKHADLAKKSAEEAVTHLKAAQ